jgi:short-subunit dehydrogenase
MLPRDQGKIVQVGSALAYRSIPLQSAYCAAKHAIVGFTDSLRCELIHDRSRVGVTVVHMPALNTPQFGWVKSWLPNKAQPVPPIFEPEVVGRAVYWAAHHNRGEVLLEVQRSRPLSATRSLSGPHRISVAANRRVGRSGACRQSVATGRCRTGLWCPRRIRCPRTQPQRAAVG